MNTFISPNRPKGAVIKTTRCQPRGSGFEFRVSGGVALLHAMGNPFNHLSSSPGAVISFDDYYADDLTHRRKK
jgi:hypothetical protein